jgi:hypothetical protein
MILRVDAYHESYRLSLYTLFWILNRTNLKLEFQVKKFFYFNFILFCFPKRLRIMEYLLMLLKHLI